MRKLAFAALAGSALTLAACAGAEEDTGDEAAATAPAEDTAEAATGVMDASTVSAEQLAGMDGISEELAAAIVAGQPYESVSAFNEVLLGSVDAEAAATIRETLFVPVNLNTASEDEIALIPGMTDKMQYEFLEYRPYGDISDFDREIGKYVDEEEVARFKQYVTL